MTPLTASLLLAAGGMLLVLWAAALVRLSLRGAPSGRVLASTGISAFQVIGSAGCLVVFSALGGGELLAIATGEKTGADWVVLLWSLPLMLLGMSILWMALVRRVWCTDTALVHRTWRGQVLTAPYRELAGAKAVCSFDDVVIPWGEGRLVLDQSQPDFEAVADCLRRRGVDLSALPPRRPGLFFWGKKDNDPFTGRK